MKNCILEVKNLSFSYEENEALKNISLKIFEGEKIALMGNNGAGKTTFFANINGLELPTRGEIYLKGEKITKSNINKLRKNIGYVFQDAESQIIASTVNAEVSFGPLNMGLPREEVIDRVDRALRYMDIENLSQRASHYLSGGEKKRVTIADILAMESEILIFDEPMAALDPINSQNVENTLQRLSCEGKTIIAATHDTDFAYRFADRIIVFSQGEIIGDDVPDKIFRDENLLKRANLNKPSVTIIWQALLDKGLVKGRCPKTPLELASLIKGL